MGVADRMTWTLSPVARIFLNQLRVVEFIQRAITLATVRLRALQQCHDRLNRLAGQALAQRISRHRDVLHQRPRAGSALGIGWQKVGHTLGREDSVVEIGGDVVGRGRRQIHRFSGQQQVFVGLQRARRADHGHHLVLVAAACLRREIPPGELLHRPDVRGLRLPVRIAPPLPSHPRGQRLEIGSGLRQVLAANRESQASRDLLVVLPCQKNNIIAV